MAGIRKFHPSKNNVYTLKEIVELLLLRDSPCLMVYVGEEGSPIKNFLPIQDSHFTYQDLIRTPEWAETQWRFTRETEEWIPVFHYAEGQRSILHLLNIERNKYADEFPGADKLCVSPKAFPREQ